MSKNKATNQNHTIKKGIWIYLTATCYFGAQDFMETFRSDGCVLIYHQVTRAVITSSSFHFLALERMENRGFLYHFQIAEK